VGKSFAGSLGSGVEVKSNWDIAGVTAGECVLVITGMDGVISTYRVGVIEEATERFPGEWQADRIKREKRITINFLLCFILKPHTV
jgi:hypothetical protein